MSPELVRYLASAYRHDILGESVVIEMPQADPKLLAEIEAEVARIDAMRFGANLANRDFGMYQRRRALGRLLEQMKRSQLEPVPGPTKIMLEEEKPND